LFFGVFNRRVFDDVWGKKGLVFWGFEGEKFVCL